MKTTIQLYNFYDKMATIISESVYPKMDLDEDGDVNMITKLRVGDCLTKYGIIKGGYRSQIRRRVYDKLKEKHSA